MILLQYAKEHRFPNPTFFVDDGYSGTNYDRPGFQAMLAEIEAGRVAVCITKDLSRLGRNSSLTGLYINFTFPKYNVRYIAINDHFDTIDPNSTGSDIAGIKNWLNEFFAKEDVYKRQRQRHDKVVAAGFFRGGLHLLHGGIGLSEADIVGDGVGEKIDPLEHEGEIAN